MSSTAPRLRPGLHVVRRDAGCVQVGLDAPHRVVLSAEPRCLDFLEHLRHGTAIGPFDDSQTRVLRDLRSAGLLAEQPASPAPVVPDGPVSPIGTVALHDHGFGSATARLTDLLDRSGVTTSVDPAPDLVVACATGPLPRAVVDPWLAEGTPHLVIAGTGHPGSLRVGPLVEPGLTACLRCVDATEAAADPRRPLLVAQLAARAPAPIDPLTLALGLAWAARDIVSFLAGRRATTWSASVDAEAPVPQVRAWERHPECGCCWDELPY